MTTDELALRQALQDLTAGQPPAPPGRHEAVRRRIVRHRWAQAAAGSAALAAIGTAAVVVAAVLPPPTGGAVSGSRTVPGWALPWSDHRDGSVSQRVLDGAVNAWRNLRGVTNGTSPLDVRKVIWYVGQTAAKGHDVIVTFEASTSAGKYLVAGFAAASQVTHGQPGWSQGSDSSPWVLYAAPAPRRRGDLVIGLNLAVPSAKSANPDNWIMVLTAPDVRTLAWSAPVSSEVTGQVASGTGAEGVATTNHGLVIANIGRLIGRVQVTDLIVGHRSILKSTTYVGVPGSVAMRGSQGSDVPALAAPPRLKPPSGFGSVLAGDSGQGSSQVLLRNEIVSRRPAVVVRCYGPDPLRVYLGSRLLGVIRCDNVQREVVARARTRSAVNVLFRTGFLTAWRVDIGSVR